MNSYSQLATEVYDLDKPIGHSFGDVEFYRERLKSCTGRVLEPAVGTGRILIPLLESGLTVDGLDSSGEMLDICRTHCHNRQLNPLLFKEKIQNFSLPHHYDAIILPAGSFLLLEKREESLQALRCFRQHLVPGGQLILDLFLQTEFPLHSVTTRSWINSQGDVLTMEEKMTEVDFLNQYTVSLLRYEKWRKGQLIQTEMQRFPLRWYGLEEFKLVLKDAGFSDIIVSAQYEYGKAPTSDTDTITFEAR